MPPYAQKHIFNETESVTKLLRNVYDERRHDNESPFLKYIREIEKKIGFVTPIKWKMVTFILLIHIIPLTWIGYNLSKGILYCKWQTILFVFGYTYLGAFGVTAGAHRYWTHRSYKATATVRWMLGIMFIISSAHKLGDWVRDHRVHHKFSEKSADPHDATRGFFFSHIGWLMMMKHLDVMREGRKIDMSDITRDPVVQFITKYYLQLKLVLCGLIPICIPSLLWGEDVRAASLAQAIAMLYSLHSILSVNSFAHLHGSRPYNPNINPSECWYISLVTIGEGWHNYHHTFPWDYKAAELPYQLNVTTLVLDGLAKLGLVSHCKSTSQECIQATIQRNHSSLENSKLQL